MSPRVMLQACGSRGGCPGATRRPPRVGRGLLLLFLVLAARPVAAQEEVVAGTVVDAHTGRPIAGVYVTVEGTQRSALTDPNGAFRITGLSGTTVQLQAVMVGYRTLTRTVRVGDTGVRLELTQTAFELNALVVTGTAGGVQKRALGNSVAQVNAAQVTETAPIKSTQDLLNGRAAGVVVMPGTGMVGSGSRIRIRGLSTLSLSGDPLIYIDGVRVNNETGTGFAIQGFSSGVVSRLNDINPDDIESIEILKGPAAATLYGTEAARGVINIITKKGRPGGTRYSFTIKQGANWFMDPQGRAPTNWWRDPNTGQVHSINLVKSEDARGTPIFRTGDLRSYNASVSGGSEVLRYYVSFDKDYEEGAERNNSLDRMSGRVNLQLLPSEKFDLAANVGYVKNEIGLSCEAGCGGAMWGLMFGSPELTDIACGPSSPETCGYSRGFRSWSPEGYYAFSVTQDIDRFTGSVQAIYRPFSWMTHRLTVGTDVTAEQNEEYLPFLTNDTLKYFWGAVNAQGYKANSRRHQVFNTVDYSGSVVFNPSEALTSETSVGLQYYQRHIEYLYGFGRGFAAPGLSTIIAAATDKIAEDDYLQNNTLGVFAQQRFGWRDRLFLTAAVRVDNNSAFGADFDFVTYPKAALSWVMNEEPWWAERAPSFLNTFKLRLAYGQSGQQPASFAALRTFAPVPGPNSTPAVTPSTLGNPNLGPERGEELEVGFDASLFDERVGIEFTYYDTHTKDAILLRSVAPSSGFSGSQWTNAGEIRNTGLEMLVRGNVLNGERLGWDLTLNLATNDNEVIDLGGEEFIGTGNVRSQVGYPVNAFWVQKIVGAELDANGRAINLMCASPKEAGGQPVPCYENGQLVAPRVYVGRPTPTLEGSISSTFHLFGRVRLGAMIDFKAGHKKYNNNERARCAIFLVCHANLFPEQYDPVLIAGYQEGVSVAGAFIQDASFAKLREVSLSYDLPQAWAARFGARFAALNVAARNLHTWTSYKGLDPETYFLSGTPGYMEQNNLPQLAQFVASLHVSF